MILNVYIRFKMFLDVMFTHESWATTKSLLAKLSQASKKDANRILNWNGLKLKSWNLKFTL